MISQQNTQGTLENNPENNPRKAEIRNLPLRAIILLVLLSFVFGSIGGAIGAPFLGRFQKNNPQNASSQQKITLSEDSAIIDVVKKASPAVVSIVISKDLNKIPGLSQNPFGDDPFFNFFFGNKQQPPGPNVQQVGAGSGFFVSADGIILTNRHVVEDEQASYTVITSDGKKIDAKVLARDPVNDLAIIKVGIKDAPKLDLTDSGKIEIGQRVIAIGNSLGQYQNTVTSGIVSGTSRSITAGSSDGSEQLSGVIQTDAAINPGNSGGPLLNVLGQVIGINTAIDRQGQLVGFAIPAGDASRALASFEKNGKITRPFIGVRYVMITKEMASQQKLPKDYGALLARGQAVTDFAVIPGSPADKAGLAENDIILEVNGARLEGDRTLASVMKNYNAGDAISLKIYHKSEEKTIRLTLDETK